jgi:hypothetical protein
MGSQLLMRQRERRFFQNILKIVRDGRDGQKTGSKIIRDGREG